jgi:DNA-binding MarR family transcriptional regulator
MNQTAELVKLWAEYEATHKDSGIADFCHFYLTKTREQKKDADFLGGIVPPDLQSQMAKMIGRIAKLHMSRAIQVLKECGINNFEDFMFLNSVLKLKEPRKTEVIYQNFIELSSGLLIIDRLIKSGHINEENDKEDRRSKRLKITKKGKDILSKCYKRMFELNKEYFSMIPPDDIQLCIQLLAPVERRHASTWLQNKGIQAGADQS